MDESAPIYSSMSLDQKSDFLRRIQEDLTEERKSEDRIRQLEGEVRAPFE